MYHFGALVLALGTSSYQSCLWISFCIDLSSIYYRRLLLLTAYFLLAKSSLRFYVQDKTLSFFKPPLSTSSVTIPSFQGDLTIFHMGTFLKQTPHIKNLCALMEKVLFSFILCLLSSILVFYAFYDLKSKPVNFI